MLLAVLYLLFSITSAQFQQIQLRGAWTYSSCNAAMVNASVISPYDNGGYGQLNTSGLVNGTSTVDLCSVLGQEQITVLQFTLQQQSVAGVNNLVFSLNSIPPVGGSLSDSALADTDNALSCQGTPKGTPCLLLKQPMTVSFDSSIATIQYDLIKQPSYYFYAYIVLYNTEYDVEGSTNSTLNLNGVPFASSLVTCSNVEKPGWIQLTNVVGLSSTCDKEICPSRSSSRPFYFGPDSNKPSSAGGNCPIIYCKIPKAVLKTPHDSWSAITVGVQGPQCSLWRINPAGVRTMTARATIKRFEYKAGNSGSTPAISTNYIQLSSRQSGAYQQSGDIPLIAQMSPVQSSQGSVPPAESGGIVTCSRNPQVLNVVNDMPPQDTTTSFPHPNTYLYNPWLYTKQGTGRALTGDAVANGCILPAAACRSYFPPGHTEDSWWYKVDNNIMPQYSGVQCNSQGMTPQQFANPITASQMCSAAARSTQKCTQAVSGECVPNYIQFNEIKNPLTRTPCLVDQSFEQVLETTTSTPFDQRYTWPGVTDVPNNYNPLNPQWWMGGATLLTSTVGDNTIQSVITIYTNAEFLGEVVSVSSGKFNNQSMLCNAVAGGPASTAAFIENTGNLPGLYFVTVNVAVGPRGNASGIAYSDPVTEITNGANVYRVVGTSVGVPAGESAPVQFDLRYTGPASNELTATLSLWILVSENSNGINGYQKVDEVTTACTITIGKVLASRDLNLGNITSPKQGYTCEWYAITYGTCIGHYRKFWMFPVNLLLYIPLTLSVITFIILFIPVVIKLYGIRKKEDARIAKQATKTAEAVAEQMKAVELTPADLSSTVE
ncbi:MAG: hypothetical protein JSS82_13905 [Bacteroidetes bacterium]|nr:hypothetical protein [Bacteroidota bacterium]